jgi:hypothetical protein
LAYKDIELIARVSAGSVTRCLKCCLAALAVSRTYCPVSSLQPCQDQIKSHFLKQPPHTVSEAAHEIEVLTGIKPKPGAIQLCPDFYKNDKITE